MKGEEKSSKKQMYKIREIEIEKINNKYISRRVRRQIKEGNKSIKRFNRSKSNNIKNKIYNKSIWDKKK